MTEKVDAKESDDGTMVSAIIAYDINLMYDGVKLDNSWAEDGSNLVTVSFSGDRTEKASMEADQIEILRSGDALPRRSRPYLQRRSWKAAGKQKAAAQVPVLDGISADDIAADSEGRQELDEREARPLDRFISRPTISRRLRLIYLTPLLILVIANELACEGSEGAGRRSKY
ncbi:MAG: hypothetical protein ACLTBV_14390 [Enterocloster bolteae]